MSASSIRPRPSFSPSRRSPRDSDLLVVESPGNEVFAAIRLAPPHREMLARYRDILKSLSCSNLPALEVIRRFGTDTTFGPL